MAAGGPQMQCRYAAKLAQCWFPELAISDAKISTYLKKIKHTEAIL